MFKNLIKIKLNIKEQDNLLIVKYKKWSIKLPIYIIIFYILYTWLGCKMRGIEISTISLYLYNFPFLLISVIIILIVCSKEILIVSDSKIIVKRYFLSFLNEKKSINISDIRNIFWKNEYQNNYPIFLPLDIIRNLKIRIKESNIEDKIYTFGVCLSEEKYKEIIGEILKYSEIKGYLQNLINITNF